MAQKKKASQPSSKTLPKASTGIQGLDEITGGGLPRGRPTLISGGAGSGKTLFGLEFLVRGATQFGEAGVFMSFEESIPDLTKNVASLGFDLDRLVAEKKLFVDHVSITRSEFGETGEYDLEGLFIRIADAVQRVGAQRVVLDTLEALFGELPNPGIVRSEIRRLFDWLKQKGLTTVITAERDQPDRLTRHGIEEFVSDCVILLDHRIREEISTRIRWSSRITQSETNSSMPCRVNLSGWSRSAVMTVVNPFCLSQSNRRRISERTIPGLGNSPKSASRVSSTTRCAPTL